MEVIITEWALQSYLDLKQAKVFDRTEYKQTIRPDVVRLKTFPTDVKFQVDRFWGPAEDAAGRRIADAFKMKWRQIGPGLVQLRLGVVIHGGKALLCRAYVKDSNNTELAEMAKLKVHRSLVLQNRYQTRGKI